MRSLDKEQFLHHDFLYTDTVQAGFDTWPWFIATGERVAMQQFLKQVYQTEQQAAYADFYFPNLNEDEKQRFKKALTKEQDLILARFPLEQNQIYFELDLETLTFLSEVTADELLFSTFYFEELGATIWGNYDLKYPVFARDHQKLQTLKKLAKASGVSISD